MNRYTILELANLCDQDVESLIQHLITHFSDVLPDLDKLQASTQVDHQTAEATLDYFGAVLAANASITEAEIVITEAVQVASVKLTQTLSLHIDQLTALLTEQAVTLGQNSGAKDAIAFTHSYLTGFTEVLSPITQHMLDLGNGKLDSIDQELLTFSKQGQTLLGEAAVKQREQQAVLHQMNSRRRGLLHKIQNG